MDSAREVFGSGTREGRRKYRYEWSSEVYPRRFRHRNGTSACFHTVVPNDFPCEIHRSLPWLDSANEPPFQRQAQVRHQARLGRGPCADLGTPLLRDRRTGADACQPRGRVRAAVLDQDGARRGVAESRYPPARLRGAGRAGCHACAVADRICAVAGGQRGGATGDRAAS